jgi:hypothetical protein
MLLKVSCSLVLVPLKIDAPSALVPSYCEVIIPGSGLRVNYERLVLVEIERGAGSVTRDKPSDLSGPTSDRDSHSQGTSNARHVATLAGLKASITDYNASNENHRTALRHIHVALA